jgi:hypothetical protein
MLRCSLVAVAAAVCFSGNLLAQDTRGLLAQQPAHDRYQQSAQPMLRDAQVQPAGVATEHRTRSTQQRSPSGGQRSAQRQQPASNGSLLSRLKMPNLIPKSLRGESAPVQDNSQPPMPYEMGPTSRGDGDYYSDQSARRAPQQSQRQTAAPQRQTAAPARTPAARSAASGRTTESARTATRQSPEAARRRNELAEALAGLTPNEAIEQPADAGDAAGIESPEDESEELPSYLSEEAPQKATQKATQRTTRTNGHASPESVDVRDALLADDAPSSGNAPGAVDQSELIGSLPPVQQPAPKAAPRRSVPAESSVAKPQPVAASTARTQEISRDIASMLDKPNSVAASKKAETTKVGSIGAEAPNAFLKRNQSSSTATSTAKPSPASGLSAAGVRPGRNVLFSSKQPAILSNIEGPQRIVVGQPAEYRVTLENRGDVAARDLTASIAAPPGAEVVDAAASNGEVERTAADPQGATGHINWKLYELAAGASQTLTLKLIPRSGREMHLGVEWSHAPVTGQATVEIQEPKLEMEISGPSDVLFGKSQRYTLTLSNPGNGAAAGVAIELTPPGGGPESLVKHTIGSLAPGESKKIELELTAREAGELAIRGAATATGDLRTEVLKKVVCRKPELQIDWRGPDKKFAGSVATYYLRVRNPGTAAADGVAVMVNLPAGAELVEASDGHAFDAERRAVSWKATTLNAGEERFMELQCRMSQPGVNQMELAAQTTQGDLSDMKVAAVTVEALADLKLEVSDPKGVIPVGEMAVYEIRIKNRGATAAKGVDVAAMFSEGLDPSHVEGSQHTIRDGRVAFRTIDSLDAGGETVFRIHAKASKSGTHIFRAEVACQELEAKLAAEETTRFFTEEERWADASTAYADEAGTTTR